MPGTFVHMIGSGSAFGNAMSIPVTANVPAGHVVTVSGGCGSGVGSAVSDARGNTWALISSASFGGVGPTFLWGSLITVPLVIGDLINFSVTLVGSDSLAVIADEWADIVAAPASTWPQAKHTGLGTVADENGGILIPTTNMCLAVAATGETDAAASNDADTIGGAAWQLNRVQRHDLTTNVSLIRGYKTGLTYAAVQEYNPFWSTSVHWGALIVAGAGSAVIALSGRSGPNPA